MGGSAQGVMRRRIRVRGIVQGVGFRPYIYRLAKSHGLTGRVLNDSEGVLIEVQGSSEQLKAFAAELPISAPPASRITSVEQTDVKADAAEQGFVIAPSPASSEREAMISPDLAVCDDCRREIMDSADRRYRYPFTNCTNCGPRFSIVEDVPYDRRNTTMKHFAMCGECQAEYDDPADRRFHAQPNACAACGPFYRLFGREGELYCEDVIEKAHALIKEGYIVAVKGIGGYHLACDARNDAAVSKLRVRKVREDKPFAVMAADMQTIKQICTVTASEEKLLSSPAAPIVLLRKNEHYDLAEQTAPHNDYLGVMLAYAPVHCLLFKSGDVFVMTSANLSDEPIVYRDDELDRLEAVADYKLIHNRIINTRVDDSVARVFRGRTMMMRRSRGFAPAPVKLPFADEKSVLACGAELKNTFCLTKHDRAFISQHIGDLENMAVNDSYRQNIKLFERLFDIKPQVLACDIHPEYFSTKYAVQRAKAENLPVVKVQHHHAHIASVLAEHGIKDKAIGAALDGTGYGKDGNIWGGEFMLADMASYERLGHFAYMPLPGGAKAVKEPWRLALWQVYKLYGDELEHFYPELLQPGWQLMLKAVQNGFNAPLSSGAGRVFDAVSAMLGICRSINYEGQAAIELERAAQSGCGSVLPYEVKEQDGRYILDFTETYRALHSFKQSDKIADAAMSFHLTAAKAIADILQRISTDTGIYKVVFSGGVCQNVTLMNLLYDELDSEFDIYMNEQVPPNDGGLSFGQAAAAMARLAGGMI